MKTVLTSRTSDICGQIVNEAPLSSDISDAGGIARRLDVAGALLQPPVRDGVERRKAADDLGVKNRKQDDVGGHCEMVRYEEQV